ncbi:ribonuclease E/G [Litoreibacter roseus]|uniref:Ribonuclease G n=1 Tax=Litoreibacter roseus TaxID=2601869 RepID=A0A6N6JJB4_9RHOB|nr:ribonuclease E/G [Litoreibacter roseus]GFE65529.1 ribonuclease G [Litoreibacter roseus]
MKGPLIVLDEIAGRKAAAFLKDGVLDDFLIAPADDAPPAPGAIYRAIADRPLKGQGGMILRLPDGQTALFRNAKGLAAGQAMLVQVTSYAEPQKAVPVTDRLIFKGRSVIVTPGASGVNISRQIKDEEARVRLMDAVHMSRIESAAHGLIVRSAAVDHDDEDIAEETAQLLDLADAVLADKDREPELLVDAPDPHELAWRDWPTAETVHGFEDHGVLDALPALDSIQVDLKDGSLFLEPTRALIAVDVNTGGDFSPAAGLKANLACARALPRQLRLRGLGGQITLDLAPMAKKDRRQFEQTLRAAFKADPVETALVGWTPLSHFELQRKRERLPLPKGLVS